MSHAHADVDRLNAVIDSLAEGADAVQDTIARSILRLEDGLASSREQLEVARESSEAIGSMATSLDGWLTETRKSLVEIAESILASEEKVREEQAISHASMVEAHDEFQRKMLKDGEALRDVVQTEMLQAKSDMLSRLGMLEDGLGRRFDMEDERIGKLQESASASAQRAKGLTSLVLASLCCAVLGLTASAICLIFLVVG